ncbi:MAG: hypothetical protein E2577_04985 [Starkeya sp.]|nr:hypothetical protein [Starkeya sp.]
MTAEYIGGVVGYWLGLYSVSFLLTWGSLACLRGNMPRYLDVVVASVAVLLTRALVYDNGFVEGVVLYAPPAIACLIFFGIDARRRAVREARAAAAAASEPTDQLFLPLPEFAAARPAPPSPLAAPPPPPLPPPKKGWNPIANHWRGAYSLGVAYWVVGTLAAIVMFIVIVSVYVVLAFIEYRPVLIFFAIALMWLFLAALTVWEYVGVWRSANRRIQERRAIGRRPFWAGIAKLTIVLSTFLSVVNFGVSQLPELAETYQMAFAGDPRIPDYGLRIMRDGTEIEITGGIKYGLTDDVLTLMKASPRIHTLHLNSVGGRVGEAMRLNKVIRDAGLTTYVSDMCASACTLAFAGGAERWIGPNAKLGFHAAALPGFSSVESGAANGIQSAVLVRSGFDKAFVDKAVATPNSSLWTPTLKELQDAHVVTDVADGSQFAASGFGAQASRKAFASDMANDSDVLAWQKRAQPEAFDDAVDDFYKDYLDGVTDDDLMETLDYWEYRAIIRNIKTSGDDEAVLDLGRLFVEELKLLRADDAQRCARFGFKGGAAFRTQYDFDSGILDRYRDIGFRVVAERDPRPAPDEEAVAPLLANILARMRGTYPADQVALLGEGEPKRAEASGYCAAVIGFYETVLKAPHAEAATLLRAQMGAELDLPPPVAPAPG